MTAQTSSGETRLSLLARARAQDAAAWRELVDLYGPLLAHWCRRCGLDSHDTADCIQDTFTALATGLGTYQPRGTRGAFRSWLWTVSRNKIRDFARRRSREPAARGGSTALQSLANVSELPEVPSEEPSDDVQLDELLRRGLEQVRSEFELPTWQAFWRTAVDGIPTAVVAEELGLSAAAIRQYRSRVMRRLHQQFGDLG